MIRAIFSSLLAALLAALLLSAPLQAKSLEMEGQFMQGGMITGRTDPAARMSINGKPVRIAPNGWFVFGFSWDHGPYAQLEINYPDGQVMKRRISIIERKYKEERITGLPEQYVSPPPDVLERIRRENAAIKAARMTDTARDWFRQGFIWPAKGRISGVFGSRRVLNDVPKRPHFGIDVAAPKGTAVVASAPGRVVMAEADLYYTGGTIMLDHGHGLTSIYSHLSKVSAKAGQMVKQGEKIGEVGSSGRSTGPHLDWRVNWFDQRLDPQLLVGLMPQ